jgi:hypothetical protein
MYSSRGPLYRSHNYYLWGFILAFLRRALQRRVVSTGNAKRNRRSKVLLRVVCFVGVLSLALFVSLVRNYQWERSQPPSLRNFGRPSPGNRLVLGRGRTGGTSNIPKSRGDFLCAALIAHRFGGSAIPGCHHRGTTYCYQLSSLEIRIRVPL